MSIDVLARAWKHSQQSGSTLLALLALSSMAHDDGVLWMRGVTVAYIGKKARTKERQTQSNLRTLEACGEIYAPPAIGRGHTTRYFVTIGLSQDEVRAVLALEYQLPKADAARIAADIAARQKAQQSAPFVDDAAFEPDEPSKKVQRSAPIKEKVQPTAPIETKGAIQRREKVQSSVVKGAIQRNGNGTPDALERAMSDPIRNDPDHDHESPPPPTRVEPKNGGGGEDSQTYRFLTDEGIGAANEFADIPYAIMRADYDARRKDNQTKAAIVKAWRVKRPTAAYQYQPDKSASAPLQATRANLPESAISPADLARQMSERRR